MIYAIVLPVQRERGDGGNSCLVQVRLPGALGFFLLLLTPFYTRLVGPRASGDEQLTASKAKTGGK